MNLTPRVLRAVAVVGVATVAPLLAAMPAHAGIRIPGGPGRGHCRARPPVPAPPTSRRAPTPTSSAS